MWTLRDHNALAGARNNVFGVCVDAFVSECECVLISSPPCVDVWELRFVYMFF